MCDRHTGIGADGLILYERDPRRRRRCGCSTPTAAGPRCPGNGVRGLAALLLRDDDAAGGADHDRRPKAASSGWSAPGAMAVAADVSRRDGAARRPARGDGDRGRRAACALAVMTFGNPQCVTLGPLPDEARFSRLGPALERHELFPERTNVEFAHVEAPDAVRILIWERGVGPTTSSGTGSCAALIAAAAFGGAARDAEVDRARRTRSASSGATTASTSRAGPKSSCDGEWLRGAPDVDVAVACRG